MDSRISNWEKVYENHKHNQLINPFSLWEGASHRKVLNPTDKKYGWPVLGSMTEMRGKEAKQILSAETECLVRFIKSVGVRHGDHVMILFRELFTKYRQISNKLVGLLLRARRDGLVQFDGEILLQNRDENVPIYLPLRTE